MVIIYSDTDPDGQAAAFKLRLEIELAGCREARVLLVHDGKDPADAASRISPLHPIDQDLLNAEAMREIADGRTREEAYRLAAQVLAQVLA